MANNAELIKQCEERAQQWLTPALSQLSLMLSIRTWSSVLVACAVLWVQVLTE